MNCYEEKIPELDIFFDCDWWHFGKNGSVWFDSAHTESGRQYVFRNLSNLNQFEFFCFLSKLSQTK